MENPTFQFPVARFYTFSAFFLLADFISAFALWVIEIPSNDITASITEFSISTSVFELVCISFARCVILIVAYALLENMTVQAGQNGVNNKGKQIFWKMLSFITLLGSFVYITYKDIVVLKKYKNNKNIMQHNGYYALCISSFVFSILDILWYIRYLIYLRKLQNRYAVLNDKESGSKDGTKEKKNVNVKRLMSLAKPESWKLFFGTIGLIGSTGSQMIAPLFFGKVIQAAAVGSMDDLNKEILTLFIIYMIGGFASFFRAWLYTLAGQSLVARLRRNLFDHMISQEVAFFDLNRTGELMNRLSSDCQVVQNALSVNISMLVRYVVQILGSVIIMLITSPRLGGVLLAVIPLVAIGAQKYGAYVRDQQKIFQDELAKSASSAEETIGSLRTVRSFSQEPKSSSEYGEAIEESFKAGAKLSLAGGFFNMGMGIMTQGAIVLVLWYGGKLVHDREMNVGELTAFILYALNVAMAFAFLSSLYGDFMKAVGASVRIFELLDRAPALTPGTVRLPDAKVNISFDDVYFHYPSRPDTSVLKAFSFTMKPGETIALVGPSGGGKSTVINLLERFYDPIDGVVTVGDHSLKDIDTNWFRKRMGIVSQEPILFATTIAKNIAYGRDATQAEIEEAARQANAHDFISTFEEGYETSVGERGIKLSGGQKQRVAIARALLMDPDVLLLDEATSALDAESEHLVQEAIDRAMVGRTVLVIAHRLSTVRDASRVIVINKGTIAEQGTHDELIAFDGVYKKLVLRQLEKGSVKDDLDDDDDAIDPSKNPEYERQMSNNKI